jgi:hypothetical protein
MCMTQSGVGGSEYPHPCQVLSCHIMTRIIAHVLYSSKGMHTCTTQSEGGGIEANTPTHTNCCGTPRYDTHTKQSDRNKRPLHVPPRPRGTRTCMTQSGGGEVEADTPTHTK